MAHSLSRRTVMVGAVAAATAFNAARPGAQTAPTMRHQVRIQSFAFVPERLTVSVGDIVRWTNDDLAPHTATAQGFGWDTGALERGDSAEITVTEGMDETYFCVFHPHMKARLVIR